MSQIDKRPTPGDILTHAFELINERGHDYDNAATIEHNFRESAAVCSIVTGKALTARDIALVMTCVKLVRTKSSPEKLDNYVDAANYVAFSACFAGLVPLPDPVAPRQTPLPPKQTPVPVNKLADDVVKEEIRKAMQGS